MVLMCKRRWLLRAKEEPQAEQVCGRLVVGRLCVLRIAGDTGKATGAETRIGLECGDGRLSCSDESVKLLTGELTTLARSGMCGAGWMDGMCG